MSSFPGSPQVLKGAIIGMDPFNPLASVFVFQYNPDTLTRTLRAQTTSSDNADKREVLSAAEGRALSSNEECN
jgi:hypothetical protein